MSAQNFLINYKMHKAANLLVSTSNSVKEVSNSVGYVDQLVFSKAFKKKFGMSPKNYKTHKEMMDKYNEKQIDDHTGSSICFFISTLQLKHRFWIHSQYKADLRLSVLLPSHLL